MVPGVQLGVLSCAAFDGGGLALASCLPEAFPFAAFPDVLPAEVFAGVFLLVLQGRTSSLNG